MVVRRGFVSPPRVFRSILTGGDPGQSEIVTQRAEDDKCQILSEVFEGLTLGTPISLMVWNKDARAEAYREMESAFQVMKLSKREGEPESCRRDNYEVIELTLGLLQ
jgi:chorismate synthase